MGKPTSHNRECDKDDVRQSVRSHTFLLLKTTTTRYSAPCKSRCVVSVLLHIYFASLLDYRNVSVIYTAKRKRNLLIRVYVFT
jgi:hypothetical protein